MKLAALSLLLLSAAAATPASAATNIVGVLQINGDGANYFDSANGLVPAGYGNSNGSTTVAIGPAVEFAAAAGSISYTADFTTTSLLLTNTNTSSVSLSPIVFRFTADTAGFFDNIVKGSGSLAGTYSVSGNTLTYNFPGGAANAGSSSASFTFAGATGAVPEPATWAMMLVGFGGIGFAMRRCKSKVKTTVAYA